MTIWGCDSAYCPPLEVFQEAKAAGITVWQVYLGGDNATHTWTPEEAALARQGGMIPLGIWVPSFGLTEDPTVAAQQAVSAARERSIYHALALDTEEEMISEAGDRLAGWVDAFCAEVAHLGDIPSVYKGARYCPANVAGIDVTWGSSLRPEPGQGAQYGPATRWGFSVDNDGYGQGFPFSAWTDTPTTTPTEEIDMKSVPFTATLDANGVGYSAYLPVPEGCTTHVGGSVLVKRDETPPVGDNGIKLGGNGMTAEPCADAPAGHGVVRVTGGPAGAEVRGFALFS